MPTTIPAAITVSTARRSRRRASRLRAQLHVCVRCCCYLPILGPTTLWLYSRVGSPCPPRGKRQLRRSGHSDPLLWLTNRGPLDTIEVSGDPLVPTAGGGSDMTTGIARSST